MMHSSYTLILYQIVLVKSVLSQSDCVDPKNSRGKCVSLKSCPEILEMAKRILFEEDLQFLRNVRCENSGGEAPYVCCQSSAVTERTSDMEISSNSLLPAGDVCGRQINTDRIIGGQSTILGEYPWLALLEYERPAGIVVDCGGSLINDQYILTAAHCVDDVTIRRFGRLVGVRLGEHNLTTDPDCEIDPCADPMVRMSVKDVIIHGDFKYTSKNRSNDIALLRLVSKVKYTYYIRPICLPTSSVFLYEPIEVGYSAIIAGWGRTENGTNSLVKLQLGLNIADSGLCRGRYIEKNIFLDDTQFCAGGKKDEDSCTGDSGGPLMYLSSRNWILEGIISFGFECGEDGFPGVYTRVSAFDDWIRSNIKP